MLWRHVVKTLSKKWFQLFAIGVIIIMSSLTYTMMFYGLSGIEEPTERYLDTYNQEDFSVELINQLTPEEIKSLDAPLESNLPLSLSALKQQDPEAFKTLIDARMDEVLERYPDVSLELRTSKAVDFERNGKTHNALVLNDAKTINRSFIEEGSSPKNGEIAIGRTYAQKNDLAIGDTLTINGTTYTVSGFVLFPDYTLPLFDQNFVNIDTGLRTVALMSPNDFDELKGIESFRFAGVDPNTVIKSSTAPGFPFVTQLVTTDNNMRSGAIYDELTQGKVMALGLSLFIAFIAVFIVGMLMFNLLQAERGQIGILKALGYRRYEISLPYLVVMLLIAFVMLSLGYGLGLWFSEPLKALYLDFYLLPATTIEQQPLVYVTAVFVPLTFFAIVSYAVISKILGERALALLNPPEHRSLNRLSRLVGRLLARAKVTTQFKYLYAVKSTGTFLLFFVGILFSTLLIFFSLMMNGMVDRMTTDYLQRVDYAYEAYVDPSLPPPDTDADERFLTYPYATLDGQTVPLHGLSPDTALYRLYDEDGNNVTKDITDGVVITKQLQLKEEIDIGDKVVIRLNDTEQTFTVQAIADEYMSDRVYLPIETLSSLVSDGKDKSLYSGVYTLEKPDTDSFGVVIRKQSLIDQSKAMDGYTTFMTRILIGAAAVIAASILFVLTAFTVEKNYYTISMLKVMGYHKREVNAMILNSYFFYSVIAYLICIPIVLGILEVLVRVFAADYGVVIPLSFTVWVALEALAVIVVIFIVGTYASRRKIEHVPLQEVLKTYQE